MVLTVFEDENWVIADKPWGWLSVPGRGQSESVPILGRRLEEQLRGRLWPVHRLDQEVSGLVLFARSAVAHRAANAWFESRKVKKTYEAWTESPPREAGNEFTWTLLLERGKRRAFESSRGKEAVTEARVNGAVERSGLTLTNWLLFPRTGRAHQLRVTLLKHAGPIVNDVLYGAPLRPEVKIPEGAIALRAIELDFSGVSSQERMGLPEIIRSRTLSEVFPE